MLTKLGYPPVRQVQGKYAQTVAAVTVGGYAGIGAMFLCGLIGLGG